MTIAHKYLEVLGEHRGKPAPKREVATILDPYNMSYGTYSAEKRHIKAEYKEKNRAAQKKLTAAAWAAWRRKKIKRRGFKEKKNKELLDLETKFKRSELDRKRGNKHGAWPALDVGKYPVGTQGKPAHKRGHQPGYKFDYDAEADWREDPEPGYLPQGRGRSYKQIAAPKATIRRRAQLTAAQPARLALPPPGPPSGGHQSAVKALPASKPRLQLKAAAPKALFSRPKLLFHGASPEIRNITPKRQPVALLAQRASSTSRTKRRLQEKLNKRNTRK